MTLIPQWAIEKSIKGGYTLPALNLYRTDGGKTKKKKPAEIAYEVELRDMWRMLALDPDFWSALGKEMPWCEDCIQCGGSGQDSYDNPCQDCNGDGRILLDPSYQAQRFFDLLLSKPSQESIDNYWTSLK